MSSVASSTPVSERVISREVVAAIGAHAAAATPGVIRLESSVGSLIASVGRSARQRIAGITPAPVTGTSATLSQGQVRLRVEVAVSGHRPAVETAAAVQRSVARSVAAGTGLPVNGVSVAILDIGLPGSQRARRRPAEPPLHAAAGEIGVQPSRPVSDGAGAAGVPPAGARSQACAAVLAAVRSVPGLRPASPVRPERARWVPWDLGVLAIDLDASYLEVRLAATRLPLPPLLEQAAAAIRQATALTPWGPLPHRLVVTALDAGALTSNLFATWP
jgi:uncharacterized alkaline shock family protein YloU